MSSLDRFNPFEEPQRTRLLNGKVLCGLGHLPHPNRIVRFNEKRVDNVSRAYCMTSIQSSRTSPIDREVLRRSIWDIMPTYPEELFQLILEVQVHPGNGPFSLQWDFQQDPNSVLSQVAADRDQAGNLRDYSKLFQACRKKLLNLWLVPIGGVWVLIVIQIAHNAVNRPNALADGQQLMTNSILVYDVVGHERNLRAAQIEARLPAILAEGNIVIPPAVAIQHPWTQPSVSSYDSGLVIHEMVMKIIDENDMWLNMVRGININPFYALHDMGHMEYGAVKGFCVGGNFPARARGRILGNIQMGASMNNKWACISAIEVPGDAKGDDDYYPEYMQDPISNQ